MKYSAKDRERFATYVSAPDANGCWMWAGRVRSGGRGYFAVYDSEHPKGKHLRASRVAWEMLVGPIPEGLVVCHKCDRPLCVNPSHLFIGTQTDNLADMRSKGRGFDGTSNLHKHRKKAVANLPRGEAWHAARRRSA